MTYFYCSFLKIINFAFLIIVLFFDTSLAQSGSIRGSVSDATTGDALIGANIVISNTSLGAATDADGNFSIPSVPAGNHQLVVSYLGYQQIRVEITVVANQVSQVKYELSPNVIEGEEVLITAQAEGQLSAINQQLTSNTIANIVSEDRIKELPDINAAESIGRLPGVSIQRSGGEANKISIRGLSPKYNTVTVNGVRVPSTSGDDRSVDLSLISSNMLDGIEVRKAITPDMDADAFGGNVDLRLKEAPDKLQIDLMAKGGYNELQDYYGNYNFTGSISNRFLNKDLGIIVNFNADRYDRSADKFSGGYTLFTIPGTSQQNIRINNIILREEQNTRSRYGGSFVLDYRIPLGKITANTFYNQLNSKGLYRINDISDSDKRHYYDLERREGTNSIFTGAIGIEQDFSFLTYDFSLARTSSITDYPDIFQWRFEQPGEVFTGTISSDMDPKFVQRFLVNVDTASTTFQHLWVNSTKLEENTTTAQLNINIPVRFGDKLSGYFKTGAKLKWLDRSNDEEQNGRAGLQYGSAIGNLSDPWEQVAVQLPEWDLENRIGGAGLPITEFLIVNDRNNFLNSDYDLGLIYNEEMMMLLTNAFINTRNLYHPDTAEYRRNSIGSLGRDYDGEEIYQAAYLMAELNFDGWLTFLPGIRYERDQSKYNGQSFVEARRGGWMDIEPIDFNDLTNERENSFLLPFLHLKIQPYSWLQLRFAYTETITRPDYIHYAPITRINSTYSDLRAANGLLKPALSHNYDLSVSVYENYIGLFTVSGFYKSIDDLIMQVNFNINKDIPNSLLPEGTNIPKHWYQDTINIRTPNVTTFINSPYEALYRGVEFDWQTHFWYLPSFLSGLILNINYTYIFSETEYQGIYLVDDTTRIFRTRPLTYYKTLKTDSTRVGRMPDQPTHIANITLGYDIAGFSLRFSALYQSDISAFIHSSNPLHDTFTGEYIRFDLALRQKITSQLEVFANLNNLNARPDRSFRGSATNNPSYIEYYGFTMDVGVRFRL